MKYIYSCVMYCTGKPNNRKLGLYMLLIVPNRPWEIISMDFIGGYTMSKRGDNYFFIVDDRFSKICVLIPYEKTIIG